MSSSVTVRLDRETERILRQLTERSKSSKSQAIKEALRHHWQEVGERSRPSAWEVYSSLNIPPARGPLHDRARHVSRLLREKLRAKRRAGTL